MALLVTSAADLTHLLAQLLADPSAGTKWFRGHGCETFTLIPRLARRINPYSSLAMLAMEKRLITRFRQRSVPLWPEGYPQSDWEQLFAMQHVGVPTRLLDWTENALIGAYFAGEHDAERCLCGTGSCRPTLWILDPLEFNRRNPRLAGFGDAVQIFATSDQNLDQWAPGVEDTPFAPTPVAIYGTHNSPRIVAQQGTFTVAGKNNDPIESIAAVTMNDGVMQKITLDCSHEDLLNELRVLGINQATVFPDLQHLAQELTRTEMG